MNILNIITQLLSYSDPCASDNPQLRNADWNRRYNGIAIDKPIFDQRSIPPNSSYTVFDGSRTTALNGSSVLAITLSSPTNNRYRVSVTSGPASFRTARAVSGINNVAVTINNNSLASFVFTGATLTGVVVGDTMRINGLLNYDTGPYIFNSLNAGLWQVLAISGTTVQVARMTGQPFSGVTESVTGASTNVQFFSADGVQIGDTVDISGTFSPVTQRSYQVLDVTPTTFDFVSALSLPLESGLTYSASTIAFYIGAKNFVYIEVDQESVVRCNEDASNNNRVNPIQVGDPSLVGYMHKHGATYRLIVVNKSINTLNVRYFLAE